LNWTALIVSVCICIAVGVLEALLGASGMRTWYPQLRKPRWHLPIPLIVCVGIAVYIIDGFVVYRLCDCPLPVGSRVIGITALCSVMVFNALWNFAFFESRSVLVGFLGLVAFVFPLLILQVALTVFFSATPLAHAVYFVWVIGYDISLYYTIWRMNQ